MRFKTGDHLIFKTHSVFKTDVMDTQAQLLAFKQTIKTKGIDMTDIVEHAKAVVDELVEKGTINIGDLEVKKVVGMYNVYRAGENFRFIKSFNFAHCAVAEAIKRSL